MEARQVFKKNFNKTILSGIRISEDLPGPGQFQLMTRQNRLSPEDDFRQLVSSNPLQI
jgi:hypothetical protein